MCKENFSLRFVNGAISPEVISAAINTHSIQKTIGAHSIFIGQVREDKLNGQKVQSIVYSGYIEMADRTFIEICKKLKSKFLVECIHVYHSQGKVKAGEISLLALVSSRRRRAAIDACSALIEEIKAKLPIWGIEVLEDESTSWKENTAYEKYHIQT